MRSKTETWQAERAAGRSTAETGGRIHEARTARPGEDSGRYPVSTALAALVGLALAGCDAGLPAGKEPFYELNFTDMNVQPKVKPQRGDLLGAATPAMMVPPEGAVATTEQPYHYAQKDADRAGAELQNPLPRTPEVVAKGKWVFEHVCITCHGPEAAGDGKVTRFFPAPPSLMRQKVRDYTDGRIFHVPMRGQNSMPSYAKQLEPNEIWAVVHYIRDLQSRLPVAPPAKNDLPPAQPKEAAPTEGTPSPTP